jgi:hypothetical protein
MQRQRKGAGIAIILAAAALALASAAVAHGATERPTAVSASLPGVLVGTWTRRITQAENTRFGIADQPDCVDVLTIARDGRMTLRGTACRYAGDALEDSGKVVQVRTGVVRMDFGVGFAPPVVAWKVSGRLLFVRALSASDNGERVLWTGTWRRK